MIIDNSKFLNKKEDTANMDKSTMINQTIMNEEGKPINRFTYQPAGCPGGHVFKQMITDLMDRIIKENGKYTLAELGYLHMNLVSFCNGQVQVKVYFAPELATSTVGNAVNGNGRIVPHPALNVFNGYMFVGDLDKVISFETMTIPMYEIERDNRDQLAVRIKDGKKRVQEDAEVVVMHCNLALVLAAAHNVSLWDENFKVEVETVGKTKKKDDDVVVMINAGAYQEFPVRVKFEYGFNAEVYNPDDAIPYLVSRMKKSQEAKDTKKKLANKVTEKAKDTAKEAKKVKNNWSKMR